MRMDTHNAATRVFLVVLPVVVLLALLGIGLWAASGAAAVDPGSGVEVGNETVEVDNTTTGITAYVDNSSAIANETEVTAHVYNGTDVANLTAIASSTETLNATDTSTAIAVDVSNETVDLTTTETWTVEIRANTSTGDGDAVSIVSVDTETMTGGGGGSIGTGQQAGMAGGVLVLAAVAYFIGRDP